MQDTIQSTIQYIKLAAGAAAAAFTYLTGGFDMLLILLLAMMVLDYLTGVLCGAVRHELSSQTGFQGIIKKVLILCVVAVAHLVGRAVGVAEVRSFVIGFYVANEGISILENAGALGVPLPGRLVAALKQLKSGGEEEKEAK